MKLNKSQISFIKEAYSEVCSDWKSKIKKNFPELFPSIEVGKWYKYENDGYSLLFCLEKISYNLIGYGMNNPSKTPWHNSGTAWTNTGNSDSCKEATEKEVQQALLGEAKRRGFLEAEYITSRFLPSDKVYKVRQKKELFFDKPFTLCIGNEYDCLTIFEDGIWAEPVQAITKEEAEKELGKKII